MHRRRSEGANGYDAANDDQACIYFANVAFNEQNVGPRNLQSQFVNFTGALCYGL
ncbi:MAG: hypothetical protein ABI442_19305 [Gemmatimonadaceae bacterium]